MRGGVVDSDRFLCVSTTLPSKVAADAIANNLVELGQAACVQVFGPLQSVYRWKGRIERTEEWLCVAKTDQAHFTRLKEIVLQYHTYEEPEIIATEIVDGSEGYLAWLRAELA